MATAPAPAGPPVALVIQRRVADDGYAAFARWQARVAERLRTWPGFLGHEVVPPAPPTHLDWVVVERFSTAEAARAWLQSPERSALLAEIHLQLVGQEDLQILAGAAVTPGREAASAIIVHDIVPADELAFLEWQRVVQAAEARFPGFLRHKIERPVAGLHDRWITILSFDNDANLNNWLESAERKTLLEQGERFTKGLSVQRSNYGFDFWFADPKGGEQDRHVIFKSNLMVLAVLYPIVYLWNYFVGGPLLDSHGVPFWLALFIGNVVSTQLLGWWAVPAAFGRFGWWLAPKAGLRAQIAGYVAMAAFYVLSMAVYAGLLAWNWGRH